MAGLKRPTKPVDNWEQVRDEWVRAVEQLVGDVEGWCAVNGWPTRRIDKWMEDSKLGEYVVPALMIQVELVKLLLEPIARYAPGYDGVIDLYRMPEYDDVATLFRRDASWQVHYMLAADQIPPELQQGNPPLAVASLVERFTAEEFTKVVRLMA